MSTRVVLENGANIRSTFQGYPVTNNIVGRMLPGEIFTSLGNTPETSGHPGISFIWDQTARNPNRWVNRNRNGVTNTLGITTDNRTRRVRTGVDPRLGPGASFGNVANGRVSANQNVVTTHRITRGGAVWVRIGARRWIRESNLV